MAGLMTSCLLPKPHQVWFELSGRFNQNINFHFSHCKKSQNWVRNGQGWCYDILSITKLPSWSDRVIYSAVLAACSTDGHGFKPRTSTNACGHVCRYMDWKGSAVMLQARNPPWLWNPGEMSPEVQNRGISGPTKRTYVLHTFGKKN